MKNYDVFLNKKSVLNCETEKDIELHNQELSKIFELLQEKAKAGAVVQISYNDPGHWNDKPAYMYLASEDLNKVFDGLDCKNGIDFGLYKDISASVYGQKYNLYNSKEECMEEAVVGFRFIDEAKTEHIQIVKNCLEFLDDIKLKNEFLSIVYRMNDFFMDSGKLFDSIKKEMDTSLDAKINRAKAKDLRPSSEKGTIDFER